MTTAPQRKADWKSFSLGEIVQPIRPRVKPSDKPDLPFIGMDNVEAQSMRLLGTVPAGTMKSSAVHFQPGDVLYGRLRPYLNKVYRPNFEGLCSAEFIVLPENEQVDGKYLQYFLNSAQFVSYASHLNEGDRPRVNFKQLSDYPVPLPSTVEEQRSIVAEIEKQFSRLDEAVTSLKRAKANLKRYKAAVLKAAIEGKLTEEWRKQHPDVEPAAELLNRILAERRHKWEEAELAKMRAKGKEPKDDKWKAKYKEPTIPDGGAQKPLPIGWQWVKLENIFNVITDGDHQAPPKTESGIPFLVIGNVNDGKLNFNKTRYVSKKYIESLDKTRVPRQGDLLFTVVGSYGIPVRVNTEKQFCVQRHIAILKPSSQANADYLYFVLASKSVYRQATEVATGTAQKTVSLGGLRSIIVPLPPLAEQAQIVSEIDQRFTQIDKALETTVVNKLRAARLRQSILKKAFSGELIT